MTRVTGFALLAAVICSVCALPATHAAKATSTNESQPNTQQTEQITYEGPLFPAVKDGKYGFIDIKGNFVIPPIFTSASPFSEGMAAVYVGGHSFLAGDEFDLSALTGEQPIRYISQEKGKWGYIDRTGTFKIPPQFSKADSFSEGLARVSIDDKPEKYGYIDTQGLFKILPKYDGLRSGPFKNGVASVWLVETYMMIGDGFIDLASGKAIDIEEAVSRGEEESRKRWIDTSGRELGDIEALSRYGVNRIVFKEKQTIRIHGDAFEVSKYGLRDDKGRVIVKATFDRLGDFYNTRIGSADKYADACIASTWATLPIFNTALVRATKCGLIDINGKFVAPPDFDQIQLLWEGGLPEVRLSEDFAVFTIGCNFSPAGNCSAGKKGIFSIKEQKIIVNPLFDDMKGFLSDGLIPVMGEGKWGYIDTSGKYVIKSQFESAVYFKDGLAQVGLVDYIDRTGKYVYRGSIGALKFKPRPEPRPEAKKEVTQARTGTGFVVSRQGHVLTNQHVIEGCQTVRVTTEGRISQLTVIGSDVKNDLAVLKLPAPTPSVARFREGRNIRSGDGVVVVGFPLPGLLASEANVTTGAVSALAGLGNDTRFLQITAPVQPGNSGGPLLDQSGHIVGVVVSKLNAMNIAKVTGDIPQNINFAINNAVAKSFLEANSVEYETSVFSTSMGSAEIGAAAKKFTLLLECYR